MTDRRELILQRLLVILSNTPTVQIVMRNRGELPPDKRPAIIMLDADEVTKLSHREQTGQLKSGPHLVDMTPEIYVVMDAREPENKLIGEDMNAMRVTIVKAIFGDPELPKIIGSYGQVRYAGCQTDMASGRSMEGQMNIQMTFTYALQPHEL
jgi:hypothetical protein